MPVATSNICRMVLGAAVNALTAQGFSATFPASMWPRFTSMGATHPAVVGERHAATEKENLLYLPQLEAIILKPDISIVSMATADYTTTGGTWAEVTVPGNPATVMLHQSDTTATGWTVTSADPGANLGFVVWWKKPATPSGSSGNLKVSLITADEDTEFSIEVISNTTIRLIHYDRLLTKSETKDLTLPMGKGTSEYQVDSLIVIPIGRDIVVGVNSLDNAITYHCGLYDDSRPDHPEWGDEVFYSYDNLVIEGDGSFVGGFRAVSFATSGSFSTPLTFPGYAMSGDTPPTISRNVVIPSGEQDISIVCYRGGSDVETEDVTKVDPERFGLYLNVSFTASVGESSPIFYSCTVSDPAAITTAAGSTETLATAILDLKHTVAGSKDGSFGGSTITTTVSCEDTFYSDIFAMKAPLIQYYLQPIGQEAEHLQDTHYVDVKEAQRPEHGQFLMALSSRDVTKELELQPLLEAFVFDSKIQAGEWTHVDLMAALAELGGVTLTATSAALTDPPLTYNTSSQGSPLWQFQRNATCWDAMKRVREYSGWLLYPDRDGTMIYQPRPTTTTTADWTWDANALPIEGISYRLLDLYRTRFLVWGKALGDNTGAYPYKHGDNILGAGYHERLEQQLGRWRSLVVLDPALADWDSIGRTVDALYDYYTSDPFYLHLTLNAPESYPTLWLYQVIAWSDSKMTWDGAALSGKKFLITNLDWAYTGGEGSCNVEAVAL